MPRVWEIDNKFLSFINLFFYKRNNKYTSFNKEGKMLVLKERFKKILIKKIKNNFSKYY
jgi:hypothetical protein